MVGQFLEALLVHNCCSKHDKLTVTLKSECEPNHQTQTITMECLVLFWNNVGLILSQSLCPTVTSLLHTDKRTQNLINLLKPILRCLPSYDLVASDMRAKLPRGPARWQGFMLPCRHCKSHGQRRAVAAFVREEKK